MKLIFLPKTQYRYRRGNVGVDRTPFDRHWMSNKQRRRRYWGFIHSFLIFAFLIIAVKVGSSALFVMKPKSRSVVLSIQLPRAQAATQISKKDGCVYIWVDREGRFLVNEIHVHTPNDLAYLLYDLNDENPYAIPVISADAKVNMDTIYYLMHVLEIAGYKKIIYKTHSPGTLSN